MITKKNIWASRKTKQTPSPTCNCVREDQRTQQVDAKMPISADSKTKCVAEVCLETEIFEANDGSLLSTAEVLGDSVKLVC